MNIETYTLNICGHDTESGLTPLEVVSTIYRHDGEGYKLKPAMVYSYDQEGEETGETQEIFLGKLTWNVEFYDHNGHFSGESPYKAYGDTKDGAETAWLMECFGNRLWADKFKVQKDN
jgi:hypothetical protein